MRIAIVAHGLSNGGAERVYPLDEAFAKNCGVEKQVSFPGYAKNIHEIMAGSGIFALTSNYEGLSNSMLEALAMGKELDLENPRTFNEKLQWLKIHDRKPGKYRKDNLTTWNKLLR